MYKHFSLSAPGMKITGALTGKDFNRWKLCDAGSHALSWFAARVDMFYTPGKRTPYQEPICIIYGSDRFREGHLLFDKTAR
jgi:hypothetical protein